MIQKIIKVGSSAAVTISKQSLEHLGVRIGDQVAVAVEKDAVTVRRAANKQPARDKKITALTLNFIERYRKDLEALADE